MPTATTPSLFKEPVPIVGPNTVRRAGDTKRLTESEAVQLLREHNMESYVLRFKDGKFYSKPYGGETKYLAEATKFENLYAAEQWHFLFAGYSGGKTPKPVSVRSLLPD